jgi:hypothetical protein
MRSSPKPAILALGAALGLQAVVGAAETAKDPKKPVTKPSKTEKKDPAAKTPGGPKDAKPTAKGGTEMKIPVPKGEPQKSVKFPLYDADGFMEMRFEVGVATLINEEDVKMQKMRIEIFKKGEDGKPVPDMDLDLPDALLNQRTKDLTSKTFVHIKCKDYDVTGNSMKFNLETRQGTLGGGVKMIINDIENLGESEEKAKVEFKPTTTEPKK